MELNEINMSCALSTYQGVKQKTNEAGSSDTRLRFSANESQEVINPDTFVHKWFQVKKVKVCQN